MCQMVSLVTPWRPQRRKVAPTRQIIPLRLHKVGALNFPPADIGIRLIDQVLPTRSGEGQLHDSPVKYEELFQNSKTDSIARPTFQVQDRIRVGMITVSIEIQIKMGILDEADGRRLVYSSTGDGNEVVVASA